MKNFRLKKITHWTRLAQENQAKKAQIHPGCIFSQNLEMNNPKPLKNANPDPFLKKNFGPAWFWQLVQLSEEPSGRSAGAGWKKKCAGWQDPTWIKNCIHCCMSLMMTGQKRGIIKDLQISQQRFWLCLLFYVHFFKPFWKNTFLEKSLFNFKTSISVSVPMHVEFNIKQKEVERNSHFSGPHLKIVVINKESNSCTEQHATQDKSLGTKKKEMHRFSSKRVFEIQKMNVCNSTLHPPKI